MSRSDGRQSSTFPITIETTETTSKHAQTKLLDATGPHERYQSTASHEPGTDEQDDLQSQGVAAEIA